MSSPNNEASGAGLETPDYFFESSSPLPQYGSDSPSLLQRETPPLLDELLAVSAPKQRKDTLLPQHGSHSPPLPDRETPGLFEERKDTPTTAQDKATAPLEQRKPTPPSEERKGIDRRAGLAVIKETYERLEAIEYNEIRVEKCWIIPHIFELPPEIRKRIFKYALFPKGTDKAPRPHFGGNCRWNIPQPALLKVCKTIRGEAIPIYYREFRVSAPDVEDLVPFLKHIGKKARQSLPYVCVKWDFGDDLRKTFKAQRTRFWSELKGLKVPIRKEAMQVERYRE